MFGVVVVMIFFVIFPARLIGYMFDEKYLKKRSDCIEHGDQNCMPCIKRYGFYIENFQYTEMCEDHEVKKPFEYKTPIENCRKCKMVNERYAILKSVLIKYL